MKHIFHKANDRLSDKEQWYLKKYLITVLCYPYGAYNETSEKVAKEVGFLATVTVNKGIISKGDSPFLLKRINVDGSYTAWDLIDVLNKIAR